MPGADRGKNEGYQETFHEAATGCDKPQVSTAQEDAILIRDIAAATGYTVAAVTRLGGTSGRYVTYRVACVPYGHAMLELIVIRIDRYTRLPELFIGSQQETDIPRIRDMRVRMLHEQFMQLELPEHGFILTPPLYIYDETTLTEDRRKSRWEDRCGWTIPCPVHKVAERGASSLYTFSEQYGGPRFVDQGDCGLPDGEPEEALQEREVHNGRDTEGDE